MLKNQFLNLRPYSWIDLIFLGYLAKFSITKSLIFSFTDFYFIGGLLLLWFFFNFSLEAKHNYSYRAKSPFILPLISLLLVIFMGLLKNPYSLIWIIISSFLVGIYLQKNKNVFLGNFSSIVRGLIQTSYFFFVISLLSNSINLEQIALSFMILLIYTGRALVGDIRDVKHNKSANKRTFPVTFGIKRCKIFVIILLLISILIQIIYFNSFLISLPLILFGVFLIFSNNGYILHQLIILTTSFFSINLISLFVSVNLLFINLIYLGIFLNLIFYPLLNRKSNLKFV